MKREEDVNSEKRKMIVVKVCSVEKLPLLILGYHRHNDFEI